MGEGDREREGKQTEEKERGRPCRTLVGLLVVVVVLVVPPFPLPLIPLDCKVVILIKTSWSCQQNCPQGDGKLWRQYPLQVPCPSPIPISLANKPSAIGHELKFFYDLFKYLNIYDGKYEIGTTPAIMRFLHSPFSPLPLAFSQLLDSRDVCAKISI